MKKVKLIIILILFVEHLFTLSIIAQSPQQSESSINLDKIINEDGWNIPYLKKFIQAKSFDESIKDITVKRRWFDPKLAPANRYILLDFYGLTAEKKLVFFKKKIIIYNIIYYLIDKKIFGVKISFSPHNPSYYVGALAFIYFSDEDGDGKLETRYSTSLSQQMPKDVPEWVKEKAKKINAKTKKFN